MERKQRTTGIIILNYNNYEDTINCIESVIKYNTAQIKFIVVDNGSNKKDCIVNLHNYFKITFGTNYKQYNDNENLNNSTLPYLSFIVSKTNDGYAQGNNKGLKLAYQDKDIKNILILNNDILFIEDIIPQLNFDLETLNGAAIVSPILYKKNMQGIDYTCSRKALTLCQRFLLYMLLFKDFFNIISTIRNNNNLLFNKTLPLRNKIIEIELPSGSCMLFDKDFFKSINSFDPNTFLYCEEDILYTKIRNKQKKNYLDTSLKCIHLGAATTTTEATSDFTLKCSIESNHYYLTHYTKANNYYLACMSFFYRLLKLKHFIIKKINK